MKTQKQPMSKVRHFYIFWPLISGVIFSIPSIWIGYMYPKTRIVLGIFIPVYLLLSFFLYLYNRSRTYKELVDFAEEYASHQNLLFRNLSVPYAMMLPNGAIIWMNQAFKEATGTNVQNGLTIMHMFPELSIEQFPVLASEKQEIKSTYQEREYRIEISCEQNANVKLENMDGSLQNEKFYAVYLYDETELNRYIRENEEERLVTGLIYIDNFDDLMADVEEFRQSLLIALIDQKISQYIAAVDGIMKKMDEDKYFVVFKQKYYKQLSSEHFSILEEVKTINAGNKVIPTLSIGIGMHAPTLGQCYDYARVAMDMALGRGGDQCVAKEKDHLDYFGGKVQQTGKNTRVKARVKAEALREFLIGKEQVIIMGHAMADIDAFGSAIGIYRIAETLGRKVHIVIDEVTTSVKPFLDAVKNNSHYEEDLIVSSKEVMGLIDRNTMLVVVDTSRPSYTECPELLQKIRSVVVIDHHRRGEETIENPQLSYIDPNASSASEMVVELMQYVSDEMPVHSLEADCMFAGMLIDTNNFMTKSGVRTFEAAAYLKGCGADVSRIRKLFREDIDSYQAKAATIRGAEVFLDSFAIATFPREIDVQSPTIIGAQAANELLDIKGIKASFVLTEYHGKIYVSARAIDEVNVQLIMEQMGGGGHISTAGTQIHHTDMALAVDELKQTIIRMIEEGDIE